LAIEARNESIVFVERVVLFEAAQKERKKSCIPTVGRRIESLTTVGQRPDGTLDYQAFAKQKQAVPVESTCRSGGMLVPTAYTTDQIPYFKIAAPRQTAASNRTVTWIQQC